MQMTLILALFSTEVAHLHAITCKNCYAAILRHKTDSFNENYVLARQIVMILQVTFLSCTGIVCMSLLALCIATKCRHHNLKQAV